MDLRDFYKNKRVLITGHTGFKGSWLCRVLKLLGAEVYGYALEPPTNPALYNLLESDTYVTSNIGDIRDYKALETFYKDIQPEVIFHLAAQATVNKGYENPLETYTSNVTGTINVCECVKKYGASSFLHVSTDKVYGDTGSVYAYKESDIIQGSDPYSNSKCCAEHIVQTYARSYPSQMCPISITRAGNVIGGGDFTPGRIVPNCINAILSKSPIYLNYNSIRPYQHVLEALFAYLTIAYKQTGERKYASTYNIGPNEKDHTPTGLLAESIYKHWGENMILSYSEKNKLQESDHLMIDNSKLKEIVGITPLWTIDKAIAYTVDWSKNWHSGRNIISYTDKQIKEYFLERNLTI